MATRPTSHSQPPSPFPSKAPAGCQRSCWPKSGGRSPGPAPTAASHAQATVCPEQEARGRPTGLRSAPGLCSSLLRGCRLSRLSGSSSQTPVWSALCCLASFPYGELTPPRQLRLLHAFPRVLSWKSGCQSALGGAHNPGQMGSMDEPIVSLPWGAGTRERSPPAPSGNVAIPQCSAPLVALLMDACPLCTRDQAALCSSQASKPPRQQPWGRGGSDLGPSQDLRG